MKILFLHGWKSVPGSVKPTYLVNAGHKVINPKLDDEDFELAVQKAQAEYDTHQPDVIVGSSRGGAVAMNIESGDTPLVLLCPAWKNWGSSKTIKSNSVVLHSRNDDVIPFADSKELVANSKLPPESLIEIGDDHRLADEASLKMILYSCQKFRIPRFDLTNTFKTGDPQQDNFLSRLFGTFNEEPIRLWGEMASSPYEYLGRPTLFPNYEDGHSVLDFVFRNKSNGLCYVSEMKCELSYQNYAYMTLNDIKQIERHRNEQLRYGKKSFSRFLDAARSPDRFTCKISTRDRKRRTIDISGAILVWGRTSIKGEEAAVREYGFADILSAETIINDLLNCENDQYLNFVREQKRRCNYLFDSLLGNK